MPRFGSCAAGSVLRLLGHGTTAWRTSWLIVGKAYSFSNDSSFCKVQRLESRGQHPLRNTQFDRIRAVSCAVNRPRRRAYPKMSTFPQSLHKRNPLLCAGVDSPGRTAQGLSLLLYSPAQDGMHIALSFACGTRDKLKQRVARSGNLTCLLGQRSSQKGQVYFGRFYLGKTPLFTVIRIHLPRSSENQTNSVQSNRPYNAK